MTLNLPLTWTGNVLLDANGEAISPTAIINKLSLYDDLVRAAEILNRYRPEDMPGIAVADVELTLTRARALAKN